MLALNIFLTPVCELGRPVVVPDKIIGLTPFLDFIDPATRSPCFFCHRQRSDRSPFKLLSKQKMREGKSLLSFFVFGRIF